MTSDLTDDDRSRLIVVAQRLVRMSDRKHEAELIHKVSDKVPERVRSAVVAAFSHYAPTAAIRELCDSADGPARQAGAVFRWVLQAKKSRRTKHQSDD